MDEQIIRKQIKSIGFSLFSPEKIKKLSVAKIVTPELYDIDGYPVVGGLMDLRLGAISPGVRCRTCGGRIKECLGHPGSIDLARPVLHVKYVPLIELGLRCFCEHCGKLKISEDKLKEYSIAQRIKKAKDAKVCPHCGEKVEKIKFEKPTTFYKGKTKMSPIEIRERLEKISDEELKKIGINPETSRPEWAVLTTLLVPPVTVRPSIILESGEMSEDDLTHKLSDIIRANQRLWENLNAGAPEVIIDDLWELLQFHVTTFFDNNISGIPPARHRSGQPLKTITERIKGKEGRIRKNLAGKRVNYSARTVLSPDPNINIDEVGVPEDIAKIVTFAETINDLNIERLKKMIENGPNKYPGANYIIRPDGKKKKITEELKQEILDEIKPGYKVERHLLDGDVVLFNRHPSLHKGSLMAHKVKVLPGRTFRIHPGTAFPYGADYDGDETNIHVPQTEEARADAMILLDIKANMLSPKNNTNFIGTIQDATTGNYLLNRSVLSKSEAEQLLYNIGITKQFQKKEVDGKEIISEILPKELSYEFEKKGNKVVIKNGKLISGEFDKNLFGVEDGELVREIDIILGREKAIETIKKAFSLGVNYLSQRGLTASIEDFDIGEKADEKSEEIIKAAEEEVEKIIEEYNKGTLSLLPGKTLEESRETKIIQVLNEVRTKTGAVLKDIFPENNPVGEMIKSGGKGNLLHITQMSACVGQQVLNGKRIDFGYTGRSLSFFKKGDLSPKARGFIRNSFIDGLNPIEFFFGAMTGRDSLMDTALRTPKSGYLYRRLASALQDLRVEYDETIRDSNNIIIQFKYGGDGIDVSEMHKNKKITPGEDVGIIAAQSFGESSTQMVLNTFHLAGVAEMQVTTGLPRIIEIFDARKRPSSPKMEIYLEKDKNNENDAKKIAEKIKEVKLDDVSSEIILNFSNKDIEIKIDKGALRRIKLNEEKIIEKLKEKGYKARIVGEYIKIKGSNLSFKELYQLKEKVRKVTISGIKGIEQVLVVERDKDFVILTVGTKLEEVLEIKGVDKNRTISNDLYEVAKVFGIEVARNVLIKEVKDVLNSQGLDIDERHLLLIADTMCNSGTIRGVTRMGIISEKESILARATFETPVKHFVSATIKGKKDNLASVIENIILNQPVPIGTGLPGLLVKVIGPLSKQKKE